MGYEQAGHREAPESAHNRLCHEWRGVEEVVLTSVGVGAGVQSSRTPFPAASGGGGLWEAPSSWLGCIRRCRDALYSDTTTQGQKSTVGDRNKMVSGTVGVPTSAAGCLFLQHPTLCFRKELPH